MGFKGGGVDPCLFMRKDRKGIAFIAIYVDNNLIVGHKAVVDKVIIELNKTD